MFTGIIEEIGKIRDIGLRSGLKIFEIKAKTVLSDIKKGDSVCVDGVCLTVVGVKRDSFEVEAVDPTLKTTVLGRSARNDLVNLERALKVSDRLSGHIVTGHVDGLAVVKQVSKSPSFFKISFKTGVNILKQITKKGSVAVNGVSLTVAEKGGDSFSVAVIPHTLGHTTLAGLRPGAKVNIETDVIAKYLVSGGLSKCS